MSFNFSNRGPLNIFLNLTSRCNLACTYCSSDGLYDDATRNIDELTTEDYRNISNMFDRVGVFRITLTGGEPLIRKDILDVIQILRPDRRRISFNTNGTVVDDALANTLARIGIKACQVSIDSADESINAITRGRGTLEKALRGLTILSKAGIAAKILATVTRHNLSLENLRGLGRLGDEHKVTAISLTPVASYGRARSGFEDTGLYYEHLQELDSYIKEVQAEYPLVSGDIQRMVYEHGPTGQEDNDATLLPCDAAKKTCSITADGWVLPCNKMPEYRCGNVRTEDLSAIWKSERMTEVRMLSSKPTRIVAGCADCKHVNYCSGFCRGEAYQYSGSLLGDNPICKPFQG